MKIIKIIPEVSGWTVKLDAGSSVSVWYNEGELWYIWNPTRLRTDYRDKQIEQELVKRGFITVENGKITPVYNIEFEILPDTSELHVVGLDILSAMRNELRAIPDTIYTQFFENQPYKFTVNGVVAMIYKNKIYIPSREGSYWYFEDALKYDRIKEAVERWMNNL